MKLSYFSTLLLLLTINASVFSQKIVTSKYVDTITYWKKKNVVGFDLSETAFINWNAGGNNSVSGLLKGRFTRVYKKDHFKWNNELIVRYGINKQDGLEVRKTDDVFRINSTVGYHKDTLSNWYHSAKFNFNTQFTNGYAYPNTELAISKPFAPAFTFLGVGAEYANMEKKILIYLSPLTLKNTLVLDQRLADEGAFGVTGATYDSNGVLISKGKYSRTELGILVTSYYKSEVFRNINLENRLSFYSDYINNFGNIDVDWQLQLDLVVNQYVHANVGLHVIYDDDIKAKEDINGTQVTIGPKIQIKQMLGVGLVYSF